MREFCIVSVNESSQLGLMVMFPLVFIVVFILGPYFSDSILGCPGSSFWRWTMSENGVFLNRCKGFSYELMFVVFIVDLNLLLCRPCVRFCPYMFCLALLC
jgi:hypothetical protein